MVPASPEQQGAISRKQAEMSWSAGAPGHLQPRSNTQFTAERGRGWPEPEAMTSTCRFGGVHAGMLWHGGLAGQAD
jgi:hypothetical protein